MDVAKIHTIGHMLMVIVCVPFPAMSVWNNLNFLSKYCFDLLLQ
jgi:hypothetical protein